MSLEASDPELARLQAEMDADAQRANAAQERARPTALLTQTFALNEMKIFVEYGIRKFFRKKRAREVSNLEKLAGALPPAHAYERATLGPSSGRRLDRSKARGFCE